MATAYVSALNDENENCVEPKNKATKKRSLDDIRRKAYIPDELPQDFLRVVLNKQQLDEKNDTELARRLQYASTQPEFNYPYDGFYHELTPVRAQQLASTLGRGRLQIDVLEARLTKNYGLVRMDPYVKLKLGNKVFETHTDNSGGKNPSWQKTILCQLPHNVDTLIIEIYDEKSFTNDEMIAFVKYPLPEALFQGKFITEWIPLSGKLGEQKEGHINIQLLFTPIENLNLNPYGVRTTQRQNAAPTQAISNQVNLPPEVAVQRKAPELFTQEDLKTIKDMFPSYDIEVIKSIMESNGGNKEATIEALLQMISD